MNTHVVLMLNHAMKIGVTYRPSLRHRRSEDQQDFGILWNHLVLSVVKSSSLCSLLLRQDPKRRTRQGRASSLTRHLNESISSHHDEVHVQEHTWCR